MGEVSSMRPRGVGVSVGVRSGRGAGLEDVGSNG